MAGELAGRYVEEFGGVLSLLRFLRRAGRLGEVDKFASAPDAESAMEVLREVMSLVYRSRRGKYCVEEEIRAEEVSRFEYLCGRECVERRDGKYVLRVRCPRLPTDEELAKLYDALKSGRLKPSVLAALALARRGGAMRGGFLSARVVVNAEVTNMVEAIGNVVRHGKAAHVYRVREGQNEGYEIVSVPVVSGEALRHAVQRALSEVAEGVGLPVCSWCRRGEFVKHGVDLGEFFRDVKGAGGVAGFEEAAGRGIYVAERLILGSCVVEDVGGFLRAPVEGASVLGVGYLVPAVEGGRVLCGFDVQFHVRRAPGAQPGAGGGGA